MLSRPPRRPCNDALQHLPRDGGLLLGMALEDVPLSRDLPATSLDAYAEMNPGRDQDMKRRIVAALKEVPETAEAVAATIGESYHDVERRCSWLLRSDILFRMGRGTNKSGRAASILGVSAQGAEWLAGSWEPQEGKKPSKRDLEKAVLAAAAEVERHALALKREESYVVPSAFIAELRAARKRLQDFLDAPAPSREEKPLPPAAPEPRAVDLRDPKAVEAARIAVWLRHDGSAVVMAEMQDFHLKGAVQACRKAGLSDADPPLAQLLSEAKARGISEAWLL